MIEIGGKVVSLEDPVALAIIVAGGVLCLILILLWLGLRARSGWLGRCRSLTWMWMVGSDGSTL